MLMGSSNGKEEDSVWLNLGLIQNFEFDPSEIKFPGSKIFSESKHPASSAIESLPEMELFGNYVVDAASSTPKSWSNSTEACKFAGAPQSSVPLPAHEQAAAGFRYHKDMYREGAQRYLK